MRSEKGGEEAMRRLRAVLSICGALAALALLTAPGAGASFGFKSLDFSIDSGPPLGAAPGAVGPPETQAGAHPYQVKVAFAFNQTTGAGGETIPEGSVRNLEVGLPPGLIGSLVKIPQCPREALVSGGFSQQGCAANAQVGVMALDTTFFNLALPVFNLEPPPGVAARLGAYALVVPVNMGIAVRTGSDYGLTVGLRNLPQFLSVRGGSLSLWGVPADRRHDTQRGNCLGLGGESEGSCPSSAPRVPFLTLPGSCEAPPQVVLRADSWEQPGVFREQAATAVDGGRPLSLRGCDRLDFSPSVEVRPEGGIADSPAGLALNVSFPQTENPDGLGEAALREAVVELPAGVSVNPAAADGLGGCGTAAIGLDDAAAPRCPDASRIGSMRIETPLISEPLAGAVYLATPGANPFGSMLALYLSAERDGIVIKLAGRIDADPATGQLTVRLERVPQLPFANIAIGFDGGPRAPLATPPRCGTYTTETEFVPHSATLAATPSASFGIEGRCAAGFAPSFAGGTTSSLAGRQTNLVLQLARANGEQAIRGLTTELPPGLLPRLGGIPLCEGTAAATGACAEASRIGSIAIAAGAGSHPFHFAGKAFLTGPYRGAPFGLTIAIPALAGPLDLGTIVVRAQIAVDPGDAHLTIATDPLPRILRGIPLRIRGFELTTDRGGLWRTPTSCDPGRLVGTALGELGPAAPLSSPFFVAGCAGLDFAPRISASTGARASRANGAGLTLVVRNPRGAQANMRAISAGFPGGFSPRLAAVQAACARATFAADPDSCPAASIVGSAAVRTSVFDEPLRGPAYLVSRGREALPQLLLALRGRGVQLRIAGFLRVDGDEAKAVFPSLPDAQILSFFLTLPRGPRAALGASFLEGAGAGLCGRRLTMPTRIRAQNGAVVERSTPVAVSGCARKPGR
jgi:hypothetical protein